MKGIILAGGRGSRLGPMATQISKALVTYGQRPQLINQSLKMFDAGCDEVIVVVSPDTQAQVQSLIDEVGYGDLIHTAVQPKPRGPIDAIRFGLYQIHDDVPVIVAASDTYVSEEIGTEPFVGIGTPGDKDRPWCYWSPSKKKYVDGYLEQDDDLVTIGLYLYGSAFKLKFAVNDAMAYAPDDLGMSHLLNKYYSGTVPAHKHFDSWLDLGDVKSLAASHKAPFRTRAHHVIQFTDHGTVIKDGASMDESCYMDNMSKHENVAIQSLFPKVYWARTHAYEMDHIDHLTLAELWLYWPGSVDTWTHIMSEVVRRIEPLWTPSEVPINRSTTSFYVDKAISRLNAWSPKKYELIAGWINDAEAVIDSVKDDHWVDGHGDLCFNNIMYSINTGNVKLIDPRGTPIPLSYEHMKLAYSPIMTAIMHDLMIKVNGKTYLPWKDERVPAFRQFMGKYSEAQIAAMTGLIFLAACPLHDDRQAQQLYRFGTSMLALMKGLTK